MIRNGSILVALRLRIDYVGLNKPYKVRAVRRPTNA